MEFAKTYPMTVKSLDVSYGKTKVLREISINLEQGRLYGILGPNGSGKTTLLKSMAKTLKPQKGAIYIDNSDVSKLKSKELSRKVACMYQGVESSCDFCVMDIVLMGRYPYIKRFQAENSADIDIAKKAMLESHVWHLKDRKINEVSGGERQRVFIARALVQQTGVVLLDEPVSHLDIHHQMEVLDIIKGLTKENKTVITVLHDLNLASSYCDYLILINNGVIVAQGEPKKVLNEENIHKAYGIKPHIIKDTKSGKPYIIPVKVG
jgi:iron complex transport system ATP-binding protein